MKQSDAKTKWCPMIRDTVLGGQPINRDSSPRPNDPKHDATKNYKCIGDECMMWTGSANGSGDCGLKIRNS